MNKLIIAALTLFVGLGFQGTASADDHTKKIQEYIDSDIRGWLNSNEIIDTIYQQNINHTGLGSKDIEVLDTRWRAEKMIGGGDLMESKLNNNLSAYLRGIKASSGGVIVEIFVMDNHGLNVAQTDPTGDYMQGDEAKWKKTYGVGAKAVLIDEVEEDGGINISQTSLTIARSNGARVGAVTVAINVDKL